MNTDRTVASVARPPGFRGSDPVDRRGWAAWIPVAAAILYVVIAAGYPWSRPGLQYDEALFVRDAVQLLRSKSMPTFMHDRASWIRIGDRSIPLMDLPYAGSIKGYLMVVPFSLFGSAAVVCRAAAVLLTALGILGIARTICREISPAAGAAVGAALAVHPAILDQTVYDNSAVALWMATLGLCATAMSRFLRTPSRSSALFFGAAMGIAVWGRLNFLWLIGAAGVSAAIFAPRLRFVANRVASLAAGFALGAAPLVLYESMPGAATLKFVSGNSRPGGMVARVLGRLPLLGGTLISDGEHRSIWGGPPLPKWQILFVAAFAMAGIAAALLAPRSRGESAGQVAWRRATALTALLFAAVMLVSRLTIAQHHFVTIVPIAALAAVLGIRRVASGGPARAAFGSAAVLFAVLCLSWNARSMVGLRRTGGQGSWSDAIESVAEVMRVETPGTAARALTWGLANNVFVLTRGIAAPRDSSAGATEEMSELRRSWSDEISEGGWFLVGAGTSAAKAGFQKAWNTARPPTRRWTFRERDGTFYAELVHVLPKDAGSVSGASRAIDNRP